MEIETGIIDDTRVLKYVNNILREINDDYPEDDIFFDSMEKDFLKTSISVALMADSLNFHRKKSTRALENYKEFFKRMLNIKWKACTGEDLFN